MPTHYCTICDIHQMASTLHCSICGVCVKGFDHHCAWMGKCIGQGNQAYFQLFLVTTTLLLVSKILFLSE